MQERFVVRYGNYLEFKTPSEISHFYAEDKTVYLVDRASKRYMVDVSLKKLEEKLSEFQFFRISRKYIVNLECIKRIKILPNRKLLVMLNTQMEVPMEVSRDRVPTFKKWIVN